MTFSDIFDSDFLDSVTSVTFLDMVIAIGLCFVIGLFIMMIYKKTYRGVMYSQSFCVSLMAMSLITTILILAVTSNVVLSLGMVGALSIVRFRTAIKDPLDIAYLFWAIAVGIILGAGFIVLALVGSAIVGLLLVVFVNKKPKDIPYMLVVHCGDATAEQGAMSIVASRTEMHIVKAKSVTTEGIDLTIELRLSGSETAFVNAVQKTNNVSSAVLVSYNGEYQG